MIKAIIFDCFGVIKTDSFVGAYTELGGDPVKDDNFAREVFDRANKGSTKAGEELSKRLGVSLKDWELASKKHSQINQDVLDYVKELRVTYKTALLTNIGKGGMERHFLPNFLDDYFDVVFASGDEEIAKPEARAYEITADRLGVRVEECVFIDDRQRFVDGAVSVGMPSFLFTGLVQLKKDLGSINVV